MTKLKLEPGEWVVVCDGRKALIFENTGDERFPNLRSRESHEQKNLRTNEIGSDAPGRFNPGVGTAKSAVEQTNFHDEAERAFLKDLAGRLDAAVASGETKSLIVIAPPRALGMIRHAYSPALKHAVRAELDKDLVHLPIYDIEKKLMGK